MKNALEILIWRDSASSDASESWEILIEESVWTMQENRMGKTALAVWIKT
jgi:hypothetical protein